MANDASTESRMSRAVEAMERDFQGIRTGRASTAIALCMENDLPIIVFDLNEPDNIRRVALGESVGTIVDGGTPDGQ